MSGRAGRESMFTEPGGRRNYSKRRRLGGNGPGRSEQVCSHLAREARLWVPWAEGSSAGVPAEAVQDAA